MANEEQLAILQQGVEAWNKWREEYRELTDLSGADLAQAELSGANFFATDLRGTYFFDAKLRRATLTHALLEGGKLGHADLSGADLYGAICYRATFMGANLSEANLADVRLMSAHLIGADLRKANLTNADLRNTDFTGADLRGAKLNRANFYEANLALANLSQVDLTEASFVRTFIDGAKISGSSVYGLSVWDLDGDFEEEEDLVITPEFDPVITVDNIKVAQFIYLILNNEEIRDVINTLTSKSVLILGRFALPERKATLDALRNKLREYDLLPIVFDFDCPTDKDFTETIKTLAGLCYFVIADVTNPKSSPLELQATVPDYQIPFVPIIQEGEKPFAMMANLHTKYNWVLEPRSYDSIETLMKALKPGIIDPAIKLHSELRLMKAKEQVVHPLRAFLGDSGES